MNDAELLHAFEAASTPEEKEVIRQQIIQVIVTDFDAANAVFSQLEDAAVKHAIIIMRRADRLSAFLHYLTFPLEMQLDAVKKQLPIGHWQIWQGFVDLRETERGWLAVDEQGLLINNGPRQVPDFSIKIPAETERHAVSAGSNFELVDRYYGSMDGLPPVERQKGEPAETAFCRAYLAATFRLRAAHSEIMNRISSTGVTEPFAGIQDLYIEQRIAVVETAKGIMTGLEAVPVVRVRMRVVESL